jgi:hypothetical protein
MKFQDLVLLIEQDTAQGNWYAPPGTDEVPTPNLGTLQPGAGTPEETIANIVNQFLNPVQVAMDSYELGTSISDAYSQYQDNPTMSNALSLLAMAGIGLLTLKGGEGSVGKEAIQRISAAKAAADAARKEAGRVKQTSALVNYMEGLVKVFKKPENAEKLAEMQGMPLGQLNAVLNRIVPEVETAAKETKSILKGMGPKEKEAFEKINTDIPVATPGAGSIAPPPALPATTTPLKTAAQVADDNFTKSALTTPAAKINWEMPPWNAMADGINTGLSRLPKTELRGAELGQYLKARPEIDDIAKQNNITPDQVRSYLDYAYPPVATTPATATTKLVSKAPAPGAYRSKNIPPTPGVKKKPTTPSTAMPVPTPVRSPADIISNLQTLGIDLNNKQAANILKAINTDPGKRMELVKKIWSFTPSGMVYNFLTNTSQGRLLAQTIPGIMAGAGAAAAAGVGAGSLAGQVGQMKSTQYQNRVNKLQQAGFTPDQIKRMLPGR